MSRFYRLVLISLLTARIAAADPGLTRLYRTEYGYLPSCNACHKDGGGSSLNAYGEAIKAEGKSGQALRAVASRDSDGDGAVNEAEIRAKANPGSAASTPAAPGDWLASANVIPREVQQAFPGATAYKPVDAFFTANEIERAKTLGVTLTNADENTIYVAVKEGKAAGAAIIVPVSHEGKPFYVLVTTDRNLVVAWVAPADVRNLPEAAEARLYESFAGKDLEHLESPGPDRSLASAVAVAVRKAAVVMHVRLKKE